MPPLTPTQKRMYDLLSDGLPHSRRELHACLWDEMSRLATIERHLSTLREKLAAVGEGVMAVNGVGYQLVRLLHSPYDGRR